MMKHWQKMSCCIFIINEHQCSSAVRILRSCSICGGDTAKTDVRYRAGCPAWVKFVLIQPLFSYQGPFINKSRLCKSSKGEWTCTVRCSLKQSLRLTETTAINILLVIFRCSAEKCIQPGSQWTSVCSSALTAFVNLRRRPKIFADKQRFAEDCSQGGNRRDFIEPSWTKQK